MSKILEYIDKLIAEQEHIVNNCLGINVQLAIAKISVLKQVRKKAVRVRHNAMPNHCSLCGREKSDTFDNTLHKCRKCGFRFCTSDRDTHTFIIDKHGGI